MARKIDHLMRSNSKVECLLDCVECGHRARIIVDKKEHDIFVRQQAIGIHYINEICPYAHYSGCGISRFNKSFMIDLKSTAIPLCVNCTYEYFDPIIKNARHAEREYEVHSAIIKISKILEHHFPLPVEEEEKNEYEDKNIFLSTGNVGDTSLFDEAREE